MRQHFLYIAIFCLLQVTYAQQEFHVFPKQHSTNPGKASGNGTYEQPWDLQTALSQKSDVVKGQDIIWLHGGIYTGRFVSTLESKVPNNYITVSAFENDKVVLNGNVPSKSNTVLEVKGARVIFKNFEITWLGDFSRDENDAGFQVCSGIRHLSGVDCRFYNLRIHDNPGLGIGSWKHGAGTIIEGCMIYNNGFMSKGGKGRGEGIYVQNLSPKTRLIKNNIIYNNYYKGIEVWSAGKRADREYVKNITLQQNVIFNNGSPSGAFRDNIIVASNDRNGINIAKNIIVKDNVLYHNTQQDNGNLLGDAPALTLGFNPHAPIENVTVDGNLIVGGYNALRLLQAKSLRFTNNTVYTGIVQVSPSVSDYFGDWEFHGNKVFSKNTKPYRIVSVKDHSLKSWQDTFQLDADSQLLQKSLFQLKPELHRSNLVEDPYTFHLALFDAEGKDVVVDFSNENLQEHMTYKIYDVENPTVVLQSGSLSGTRQVVFPMSSKSFKKPLHNSKAQKTLSNLGVFRVTFESQTNMETPEKKKVSGFKKFLKWLGF